MTSFSFQKAFFGFQMAIFSFQMAICSFKRPSALQIVVLWAPPPGLATFSVKRAWPHIRNWAKNLGRALWTFGAQGLHFGIIGHFGFKMMLFNLQMDNFNFEMANLGLQHDLLASNRPILASEWTILISKWSVLASKWPFCGFRMASFNFQTVNINVFCSFKNPPPWFSHFP